MIYLPKQKVLFIHNPKTAGTSISQWLTDNFETIGARKHANAKQALMFFDDVNYIFGVVRNPFDRLVSWHKFINDTQKINFKDWVIKNCFRYQPSMSFTSSMTWARNWYDLTTPQYSWFNEHTDILKFENLNEDFTRVQDILGCRNDLNVLNSTHDSNYLEFYDDELKELVTDLYFKDIVEFGYKI